MENVSFLTSVQSVIQQDSGIKIVFTDNRGTNKMQFERHLLNVPYADMVEAIDFDEHSDNSRIRESTISGIIVCLKERDIYNTIVDSLVQTFKGHDNMNLSIDGPGDFKGRLYQIPFTVTGFQSVEK